jgi:SsrA-binding protein
MKNETPSYKHKKAYFDYQIHKKWTAGIQLLGWEVKALRSYNGEINGSFCKWNGKHLQLINSKISPLKEHMGMNPEEMRVRNLLLNKSELRNLVEGLQTKGYTCVPLKMYCTNTQLWKIEIALVTGLKKWDKRELIKKKDLDRASRRSDN